MSVWSEACRYSLDGYACSFCFCDISNTKRVLVHLYIPCVGTNGLCQCVWHTIAGLEEYESCRCNHSEVGKCLRKVGFADGFHRYLLTAEECRGGGLLGSISAPVGAGPIHTFSPDWMHCHSSLCLSAMLLLALFHVSWSLAPCF